MELIDRFRYIIKLHNLSPSSFADEIGVQRSSVSHVLSGRNKPGMEFIQKVLQRFPKVDAAWLISGSKDGQMPLKLEENIVLDSEPQMEYNNKSYPDADSLQDKKQEGNQKKKIVKLLVFYDDNTFEEFRQS